MKKFKWLGIILPIAFIAAFLVWSPADAQRGAAPVEVVNTAAEPVPIVAPIPIPVTGSLAVSNEAIPITGTVNVSGTAHVMVDNEDSNPVLVRDVTRSEKIPFKMVLNDNVGTIYVVPENKILVIEYASGYAITGYSSTLYEGPINYSASIYVVNEQGGEWYVFLPNTSQKVSMGGYWAMQYAFSNITKIYFVGGTEVGFSAHTTEDWPNTFLTTFSGYLMDAPLY